MTKEVCPEPRYPSVVMRSLSVERINGFERRQFEKELAQKEPRHCEHCGSKIHTKRLIDIAREEAAIERVAVADMRGPRKGFPNVVRARMKAMARSYVETNHTTVSIGRFYGDRDHTCVTYARKWCRARGLL